MADYWGSYASGLGAITGFGQQQTRQRAGSALAAGRPADAAREMYRSGDISGGREIETNARTTQAAQAARELATTQRVAQALREARDTGQDLSQALVAVRPALLALGTDEAALAGIERKILADPSYIDTINRILDAEAVKYSVVSGGNGDQVVVGLNERTGASSSRLSYVAPRDPIVTPNAVITPPVRPLAAGQTPLPGQAPPAPMAGPAIGNAPLYDPAQAAPAAAVPTSAMVGITAQAESRNRERDANGNLITSPAGAQGRMQVMPTTNTDPGYGVVPARDNSDAERTRVGEDYLAAMMREYGGDPAKAWAAYNWGPGNLDRVIAQHGGDWLAHAPAETRAYVSNNLAALNGSQGGNIAQGDDAQDPLVTNVPRVETTSDGYRIERFTNPAEERAARNEERAQRREERTIALAERQAQPVRDLTPAEVAARGLPEGTVAQIKPDGSLNVINRGGERFTEGQRLSAAFYHRALGAEQNIDRLSRVGNGRPSAAVLAFGEGRIRENALSPTDRQWVQAARDWLAPILRRDTGAAVSPGELVTYMGTYIPNPTDDDVTLAQKAASRRRAQEGLRGTAGGAYDELLQTLGVNPNAQTRRGPPFELTPAQLESARRVAAQREPGRRYRPGDRLNPLDINPADPRVSLANIQPGQWFIPHTGGEPLVMPNPNPYRTQRRRR